MEDVECLPENSSLNVYLKDLGFSDLQVTKKMVQKPGSIRFEVSKRKSKRPQVETIDEEVIDQINIIVSTQMLFEEDILNIEKLLSNFEVVKSGMLKCIFKDLFGVAVIFIGLCLYWVVGYFAFLFISSFYAYNAALYLKRKYFYRIRLRKLSSIIQANFMLLKKTIKFIEENNLIECKCAGPNNSKEFLQGFEFYKNFKGDFLLSVNEMINIFITSTQKLISKVPLYEYIENPEYYLCNIFKRDYESANLSTLYDIYLLMQSEFLQRLILSLIPNVKLLPNDNFNEINEVITETCLSLLKIKKVINKKFKFLFFSGIHSQKTEVEFKFPKKNVISGNTYVKEFVLNIHETSKHFQNLLLRCRILEENIKCEISESVGDELVKIQSTINSCQRNITDCLILLKKFNAVTDKSKEITVQDVKEIDNAPEKIFKVEVGYTDLDPKVEDEIFEMYLDGKKDDKILSGYSDWDLDDKLEKEYSQNVIKELKNKLVEKANHWKKRERELLQKKGLIDKTEVVSESDKKSTDEEESVKDGNLPFQEQKTFQHFKNNSEKFISIKKNEEEFYSDNHNFETEISSQSKDCRNFLIAKRNCANNNNTLNDFEIAANAQDEVAVLQAEDLNFENTQSPLGSFKTNFFSDLNKAREKIFNSSFALGEELFYDSVEDKPS